MEQALAFRRKIFLAFGLPGAFLVFAADSMAGVMEEETGDPDLLTVILLVVAIVDTYVLSRFLLGPSNIERLRDRLSDRGVEAARLGAAKVFSTLAASVAMTPLLLGFVLMVMSGDAWRLYLFAIISLLTGFYFWRRVEEVLRHLDGF